MKTCTKCLKEQALTEFSVHKRSKDGLQCHCKACNKIARDTRATERAAYQAQYYIDNKAALIESQKQRDANRTEEISLNKKAHYIKHKVKLALYKKEYRKLNPGKINAKVAQRKAAKLQQTPKWLTKTQLNEIEAFYILAKELQWLSEELLHVDHIVPLQGKNVSGLHVPWNLQILPASLNISKGNRCV